MVPSVTLIVGCGVSSLTLLMLIIIYVSVWRWCPQGAGGALGPGGQWFPGRGQPGSHLIPSPLRVAMGVGVAQSPLPSLLPSLQHLSPVSLPPLPTAITDGQHPTSASATPHPSIPHPPTPCGLFRVPD